MFQLVLFSRRPLGVQELLHVLVIPDDREAVFLPSKGSFRKRIATENCVLSCAGNFLEIKEQGGEYDSLLLELLCMTG